MNLPWEAIVTIIIALIGFICWLTKISVMQDMSMDTMKEIQKTITSIESTYVETKDFSREIGRIDQSLNKAHERIDIIRQSGYNVDKKIGERQ